IKRLPVTRDDRVVGIVSRSDLLRALAQQRTEPGPADDSTLRDRMLDMLAGQPWINLSLVNVVVENGTARLSGLIGSETERRALHVAAHSAGITRIDDQLSIGAAPRGI
ncbi:MAG TPA: BON domain-containing protein, partial [Candidatus Omnitrophota bacterium]|nr:BON domain-containing protein [Candidatus Omnitrophota bacterium]